MENSKHNVLNVTRILNKKNDVFVMPESRIIQLLAKDSQNKQNDLGNKSWGKIDYLKKQRFTVLVVDKINKKGLNSSLQIIRSI